MYFDFLMKFIFHYDTEENHEGLKTPYKEVVSTFK
jgi:hypothetical protein